MVKGRELWIDLWLGRLVIWLLGVPLLYIHLELSHCHCEDVWSDAWFDILDLMEQHGSMKWSPWESLSGVGHARIEMLGCISLSRRGLGIYSRNIRRKWRGSSLSPYRGTGISFYLVVWGAPVNEVHNWSLDPVDDKFGKSYLFGEYGDSSPPKVCEIQPGAGPVGSWVNASIVCMHSECTMMPSYSSKKCSR